MPPMELSAMDSGSEGAALGLFGVGPISVVGRAVAIQVLFGRKVKAAVWMLLARAARRWAGVRRWLRYLLGGALWLVNPRNPGVILAAILGAALLLRRYRAVTVRAEQTYHVKFWSDVMKAARTYDEWAHAASMLDRVAGGGRWLRDEKDLFDEDLVRAKLNDLRVRRRKGDTEDMLFCMRVDLVRNLGNMCNPDLHKGRLRMPRVIQEYIQEVRHHLRAVCEADSEGFSVEEKIAFIDETRHAFGRTALLLSGGAALGAFHLGVVRTLIEHRLLPRVVAGASVGSITCSFTATRTWSELQSFFDSHMPYMRFFDSMGSIIATAHRLLTKGAVHEIGSLQRQMRKLIGDLTFQEAYDLSGRVLGISVCSPRKHEPPRCLNYLTSPQVVIWSAVTASCAFPGLFEAQELMAKDRQGRLVPYHSPSFGHVGPEELNNMKRQWRDGSLESDLPMLQLKELFNVNHYIVSQANPHIAPLLRLKDATRAYGGYFAAKLAHIAEMEVKHRCNQALEMGFQMGGLAKLFQQEWEGDVTIVMPATLHQFAKIIQNPSPTELRKAVVQGQRCTWEKLSAIEANCGIELMLDSCVSELYRRWKVQKEAERQNQAETKYKSTSTTKRIPSWNLIAREFSTGSPDVDGISEHVQAGGPWGGPSLHKLRAAHSEGSDSDSGTEKMDAPNLSWTRVGGPLMKSASAIKFIAGHDTDGDSAEHLRSGTPQDSGDDGDGSSRRGRENRARSMSDSWDRSPGKRGNKIWSRDGCSPPSSSDNKSEDNDSTEERDFSFSCPPSYPRASSPGAGVRLGDRGLTASGEGDQVVMELPERSSSIAVPYESHALAASGRGSPRPPESEAPERNDVWGGHKRRTRERTSWNLNSLQVPPTGTQNLEEGMSGQDESRALPSAYSTPVAKADTGTSLERAAFGSSVVNFEDLPDNPSDTIESDYV